MGAKIYYYTLLPLNLANQQASKQASNNQQASTSPFRFGQCSAASLQALLHSGHPRAWVVALPNPSFELKIHRWRPGTGAPSLELPSLKCAVLGQKQPFFAKNSPQIRPKRPNEGKQLLHTTCALTSPCQRALWCPSTRGYVREMAQKGAKKPQNLRNVHQPPEPKQGPYLGLRGSRSDSEGT